METLSIAQAQKLALLSQGLPQNPKSGGALQNTLSTFERIGYVQIDTISVVQRAHHHTLWSRNSKYQPNHLDKLVKNRSVFEYWSHAAAYLPMRDYRFTLPRKEAIKSGDQNHWYRRDNQLMNDIMSRIEHEGPLMAKDFESAGVKKQGWGTKPTKQALENLYMQGDLMITERRNVHKVYDLTERVLPPGIDTSMPSDEEYGRYLVMNYLRAHGFGHLSEINYLLKNTKQLVSNTMEQLCQQGEIFPFKVDGHTYYTFHDALDLLGKRLNRQKAKILSPFDNLLIQRKRAQKIFNFDYLLECYVPADKRQFGYFCLPVMWDGKLVARVDCKVDKPTSTLQALSLHIEPTLRKRDDFHSALEQELSEFAQFNQCEQFKIQQIHA